MVVVSLGLAWFANELSQARFEANFIDQLETLNEDHNANGSYYFDYQLDEVRGIPKRPEGEPLGPTWIRSIFGKNVFSRISKVTFSGVSYVNEVRLNDPSSLSLSNLRTNDPKELLESLNVSKLKSLQDLSLTQCEDLRDLTWLTKLKQLRTVIIRGCKNLESLDGVGQLDELQKLIVSSSFESEFADIGALRDHKTLALLHLDVDDSFPSDENWSTIASLPNLDSLRLDSKKRFRARINQYRKSYFQIEDPMTIVFDDLPIDPLMAEPKRDPAKVHARSRFKPNPTLENLSFRDMEIGLEDLSCFREMPKLSRLTIFGSKSLTSLNGLESCSQLRQLHIKSCPNLRNVDAIEHLANLDELSITYSHVLVDPIPVLACKNLTRLDLSGLHAFKDLQFLNQLQKLELLKISDSGARSLIGLDRLVSLKELEVQGSELETIGCEEVSASIEEIDFGDCSFLIDLSGIENISSLSVVDVSQCEKLRDINGLIGLQSLQIFDWADCDALDVGQVATLLRKFPRLVASPDPDVTRSEIDGDRSPSKD
jgi:hypothetical protein